LTAYGSMQIIRSPNSDWPGIPTQIARRRILDSK
jgi:hypothetical protein